MADRETAREEIRRQISCKQYLTKSKGSGMYVCPFCNSGTGENGTGALKLYETNTWTCHKCGKSGDVIDLYQKATGADYNTALRELAQQIGLTIEAGPAPSERQAAQPSAAQEKPQPSNYDFTGYYVARQEWITQPAAASYLKARGISQETAERFGLGFDPKADPASAPGGKGVIRNPAPRIIIPTSKSHYIARSIDPATPKEYKKLNPKGCTPDIFNIEALYQGPEVFITEGAFDALSILEIGTPAASLNSAANADKLIDQLREKRTDATLILCLDNDEAGKAATEKLCDGLRSLDISFIKADINGGHKDPNEHLQADREGFAAAIQAAKWEVLKPDNTAYYLDTLMATEIERFRHDIKTGFDNLDAAAGGGLYSGLYVLAAISSLGKTSFALQLADQIAERGTHVLFFTLEQSRLELVSKSLARRTALDDETKAVKSLSIRKGYLPEQVKRAATEYKAAVADRMNIIEGNFACDISFIGEYIRRYIRRNETRPVVFIDYLQILQPTADSRQRSAKEITDSAVHELKRISRDLELPVIVISSVNRANYLTPIDFESLKESGGIEFTADVVWGLQLQCLHESLFDKASNIGEKRARVNEAKAANPREIELVCLKNRFGISNYSCRFDYYPAADLFTIPGNREVARTPKAGRKL